jgi:hypothetical protein
MAGIPYHIEDNRALPCRPRRDSMIATMVSRTTLPCANPWQRGQQRLGDAVQRSPRRVVWGIPCRPGELDATWANGGDPLAQGERREGAWQVPSPGRVAATGGVACASRWRTRLCRNHNPAKLLRSRGPQQVTQNGLLHAGEPTDARKSRPRVRSTQKSFTGLRLARFRPPA